MSWVLLAVFVCTIVGQAARPAWRVEIVLGGAGLGLALGAAAGQPPQVVLSSLPWDVLVILGSLGVISRIFAESRLFTRLAVLGARLSRARPTAMATGAALVMFFVSGLVNNLTALLLVLPVVIAILELVGTTERHLRWTVGVLLVACNLGGASTPIGDFPAILLLGAGAMGFNDYLVRAFPIALFALLALLAVVHLAVRPARDVEAPPLRSALTVAAIEALHQRVRLDLRLLVPASLALVGMLAAWTLLPADRAPPHLVAWVGATAALLLCGRRARGALLRGVDLEATLFLFGLFVLVGVVRESGFFASLAEALAGLDIPPSSRLYLLVTVTGVATGLFSAGPSMAAMLEVGRPLADTVAPAAVYLGLAFGVCAGSSLLLTAATSGPLAQSLVERAAITDDQGAPLRLTFQGFLPVGALSFLVILAVGLGAVRWLAGS